MTRITRRQMDRLLAGKAPFAGYRLDADDDADDDAADPRKLAALVRRTTW